MADDVQPRWVSAGAEAGAAEARYDEIARLADETAPRFARTFTTRLHRLADGEAVSLTALDDDFHSMRLALRLSADGTITDAAARMERRPYGTCPNATLALGRLAGINVGRRAMEQARERIGFDEGCLHLFDMLHVAFRSWRIAKGHDMPFPGEEGRRLVITTMPHARDTCVSFAVEEARP